MATVVYLEAKATDDALELFDVIMTSELLARAERQSNADKLSRYARLGKDASRLASADYRPELADLPDQKLWRTDPNADYGVLDQAARGKIGLSRVTRHWPDIVRVVASVHSGQICASDAMRMLQRGGNPTQLGDALAYFGRIFKTLHVLTYVDRKPYRRGIKRMRNL